MTYNTCTIHEIEAAHSYRRYRGNCAYWSVYVTMSNEQVFSKF